MADSVELVQHFVEFFFALFSGRAEHPLDCALVRADGGVGVSARCEMPRDPDIARQERNANAWLPRADGQKSRTLIVRFIHGRLLLTVLAGVASASMLQENAFVIRASA